jgi:hypothetical protein
LNSKKRIVTTVIALIGSLTLIFCVYKTRQLYFSPKNSKNTAVNLTAAEPKKTDKQILNVPKLTIFKNPALATPKLQAEETSTSDQGLEKLDLDSNQQIITHKYMIKVLSQQQGFLRRCFENHLRSHADPVDKGTLVVEFMVLPFGEIRDVEIKDSIFKDPTFENCIQTVFLRTQVKKFTGDKFLITFPLEFE